MSLLLLHCTILQLRRIRLPLAQLQRREVLQRFEEKFTAPNRLSGIEPQRDARGRAFEKPFEAFDAVARVAPGRADTAAMA
jgi:hypothetical protein